jgi:two-component system response regulator NreC
MDAPAASVGPIRIVLADDHAVVRRGLELLLEAEQGFEVVASVGDTEAAIRTTRAHKPDVLVLDLNMPGGSSLDAIPQILEGSPGTSITVLTMQNEPAFARQALGAGALAYVLKEAADDELVEAIRRTAAGQTYLNPQLGARMAAEPPPPSGPPDDLSQREVEVTDDGSGFDPQVATNGFGLAGMRERAQLSGGQLTVTPSASGTIVRATFALSELDETVVEGVSHEIGA